MNLTHALIFSLGLICAILSHVEGVVFPNITCYQCNETKEKNECKDAKPKLCPMTYDRCLTHYTKDRYKGEAIRRECGLAPCRFPEWALSNSLKSQFEACDMSKDEYFCVFCCQGDGCNTSSSLKPYLMLLLATTFTAHFILK